MTRIFNLTAASMKPDDLARGKDVFDWRNHKITQEQFDNAIIVRISSGDEERVVKDRSGEMTRYAIGRATMERVFREAGLTNLSDLQAVMDAVEKALTPAEGGEVQGLPVSGYKKTQPEAAIFAVNRFKEFEERVLRDIDHLQDGDADGPDVDWNWLVIGRTQLQQAFMSINRAIFQPERVTLPEDLVGTEAIDSNDL
jgi:hypothetical protein